ncbi:MAG: signal peptidase I [Candidatus Staskawiczbacteria bacterium]|nr:signal peptidase I [Candidatus Staskawiczbacteria bacterium]MBI3337286.1 signal peptidase I [Candidatus Staskawiczbacteria bacterium]
MEQITKSNNQPNEEQTKINIVKKYFPFVFEVLKIFVIASVIVLPIRYFLFQPFIVKGESMVPNFQSGDYLIIDEISYKFKNPERGDIIVFKYPKDTSQKFIKRVIGLPGETVEIKDGKVTIYKDQKSQTLDEKYLPNPSGTIGTLKLILTADEYFVLGDNREFSYDSRVWGSVPAKNIIGKVFLRVLPVVNISKITVPSY